MLWRPPRFTLFPYTTLFRSCVAEWGGKVFRRLTLFVTVRLTCSRALRHRLTRPTSPALACGVSPTRRQKSTSRGKRDARSEEHTSELQSRRDLVCRLLLEKK